MEKTYRAINWNVLDDALDKAVWEKLTEQFWLDTRIPLSNDLNDWKKMKEEEQVLVEKVFGGLTLLDTLQSVDGMSALKKDALTSHEAAVLNNIEFMESVHAKSYSSIFSTLNTPAEIEEIFEWTEKNEYLQYKAEKICAIYRGDDALMKKAASVFLESFLFYSGFYAPLYFLGHNRLNNVAEIIKLILRDESVHGTYIGYKFQIRYRALAEEEQEKLKFEIVNLLYDLYPNEEQSTTELED